MFEDRWAAVLRFLPRCFFNIAVTFCCIFCMSVFCIAVFFRSSFVFVLQFFCIAVFVALSWFPGLSAGRVGMV